MQIYIKKKLKKQKNPDFIKQCNWKVMLTMQKIIYYMKKQIN